MVNAWFSCGAASACAAKLAVDKYGLKIARVVYCDTSNSEHPDNMRFLRDTESWLSVAVVRIRSEKYSSIDDVFEKTCYMAGIAGARCTTEMKKIPRFEFQSPDDVHVFGYTADEAVRIARLESNNPELKLEWPLRDANMTKMDCFAMLRKAGIKLPAMYGLGYKNNNCIGCVKASSPGYWNKIRHDFPQVFERRAKQSREIGARLVRVNGKRIFLDELPPEAQSELEYITCGPECNIPDEINETPTRAVDCTVRLSRERTG